MTAPGYAHRPGGATSHLSASARFTLAAGLLALGIGDLAVINMVLLPRYFADARGMHTPPPAFLSPRLMDVAVAMAVDVGMAVDVAPAPAAVAVAESPVPAPAPEPRAPSAATGDFPDLLFARNKDWLSAASRETLDRVADVLKESSTRRAILSGHTDNVGPPGVNRALSRARARRASRYLQVRGIDPAQIEIQGFGSERPVAGEPSPEARARNRRVEITVE
jgi:outer membrane protein OmpA-like peptidoglycan-associated protein